MGEETLELGTLAKEGYQAYGDAAGWKTFDARAMPRWEDVGPAVQERWTAAARQIATRAARYAVAPYRQHAQEMLGLPG